MLLQQSLSLSSATLSFPSTQWTPPFRHGRGRHLLLPPIRMGGGPRTFPGGVSKWQWKRMQAKKSKQLLKARLLRERQLYETRKRAELKAAVSQLEKPWELVQKAPTLFSVSADEQVKALADRFQKPGGFDMWSERDGPRVIKNGEVLPTHRFFPRGVVHGVRPYGVVTTHDEDDGDGFESFDDWIARGGGGVRRSLKGRRRRRERAEGVRQNADEKTMECAEGVRGNAEGNTTTKCIDVKNALSVNDDNVVDGRGMNQLSLGNLKGLENNDSGARRFNRERDVLRSKRNLGYGESVDMGQLGYESTEVLDGVVGARGADRLSSGRSSRTRGGGNGEKSRLRVTQDLGFENSKGSGSGGDWGRDLSSDEDRARTWYRKRRDSNKNNNGGLGRNRGRSL